MWPIFESDVTRDCKITSLAIRHTVGIVTSQWLIFHVMWWQCGQLELHLSFTFSSNTGYGANKVDSYYRSEIFRRVILLTGNKLRIRRGSRLPYKHLFIDFFSTFKISFPHTLTPCCNQSSMEKKCTLENCSSYP